MFITDFFVLSITASLVNFKILSFTEFRILPPSKFKLNFYVFYFIIFKILTASFAINIGDKIIAKISDILILIINIINLAIKIDSIS